MSQIGCIDAATEIIGTKWSAHIVRVLASGPKRYRDIESGIAGINPRILCQRLDMLAKHQIVTETDKRYELTPKGRDLLPIIEKMADWGDKHPSRQAASGVLV